MNYDLILWAGDHLKVYLDLIDTAGTITERV